MDITCATCQGKFYKEILTTDGSGELHVTRVLVALDLVLDVYF